MTALTALALTLAWAPAAHAGADAVQIHDTLRRFNEVALMPLPVVDRGDLEALVAGEVVTILTRHPEGHHRVVAFALTDAPKETVWVATQDPHFTGDDEAIEANVALEPHKASWYGFLEIPRPFHDRHWVVDVWDNVELADASGGAFWEHPWRLRPGGVALLRDRVQRGEVPGVTSESFESAIETPVNEGGIVVLELSEGESLYAYHITSSIGGAIPQRLVAGFIRTTMEGHVRALQARARDIVPGHYVEGHAPVLGVGSSWVPFFE